MLAIVWCHFRVTLYYAQTYSMQPMLYPIRGALIEQRLIRGLTGFHHESAIHLNGK